MEQTFIDHVEARAIERRDLLDFKSRVLAQMPSLAALLHGEPEAQDGASTILAAADLIARLKRENAALRVPAAEVAASPP